MLVLVKYLFSEQMKLFPWKRQIRELGEDEEWALVREPEQNFLKNLDSDVNSLTKLIQSKIGRHQDETPSRHQNFVFKETKAYRKHFHIPKELTCINALNFMAVCYKYTTQ